MQIDHYCAHKHCNCRVDGEDDYCSEPCRAQGRLAVDKPAGCDCGHEGCDPSEPE